MNTFGKVINALAAVKPKKINIMKNIINFFKSLFEGKTQSEVREQPKIKISRDLIDNLLEHMVVHLKFDNDLMAQRGLFASDHYLFVYSGLRHFVFGSTLKVWNKANGAVAFLNKYSAGFIFSDIFESLGLLKFRVKNDQLTRSEIDAIKVTKFNLKKGICIIITLPKPRIPPEAFFFAIYTTEPILNYRDFETNRSEHDFVLRVFTLEYSELESNPPKTMIGEWFNEGRNNLGKGPIPNEKLFLKEVKKIIGE